MSRGRAIAIVSALAEEIGPLAGRLARPESGRTGGVETRTGELGGRDVCLAVTGEGRRRAAAALERLLSDPSLEAVLGIGVAGGLTADLGPCDLVLGDRVIDPGGVVLEPPEWKWGDATPRGANRPGGTVVTLNKIAPTPADKQRLASRFALTERSVVDLESAAWATAAVARGLPWLVVRSVSDTLEEALPLDFNRLRRADGGVSRRRVVAHAMIRPRLLVELARLRRRVKACALRLADATEALLP